MSLKVMLFVASLGFFAHPSLAAAPVCETFNVAAGKVWLEKGVVKPTKIGSLIDKIVAVLHLGGAEDTSCDFDERSKDVYFLDADLDFQKIGTFMVPDVIPVAEGKARVEETVTLEMGVHDCDGYSGVVTCVYKRRPQLFPLSEWAKYRFKSCSVPGIKPGTTVQGNALSLHIGAGGKNCPDRRTTASFTLNACDVGALLP